MKNVTISMDEALLRAVRIEAAKAGKSVSKFIGEVVALKVETPQPDPLTRLLQIIDGPGYPGLSENLPMRVELYSERDHDLLSRYEHSRVSPRSSSGEEEGNRKATPHRKKAG